MPKCSGLNYETLDDCEKEGTKQCSGCHSVYYCSKACQTSHWETHIWNCKVPIHTGHFLLRACFRDLLPSDPQTCEDYGFERAGEHVGMLFGLYQQFRYAWSQSSGRRLTAKELNKWRKEGTLIEKIKEAFEAIPEISRGMCYPWFCQNQWILDGSPIPEEYQPQAQAKRMEKRAWERMGKDHSAEFPSWPETKRMNFWHYAMILSSTHPSPREAMWIRAGYCVVRDDYHEMRVAAIYTVLFIDCTFEEYNDACDSSKVFDLITKYDVLSRSGPTGGPFVNPCLYDTSEEIAIVEGLRVVLSMPHPYSVWSLKCCVLDDGIKPIPAVIVDYGFMNCKTPSEREALANKYRAVFKAKDFNEIKLHEACIQGKIFEYAKDRVSMTKEEKKVMKKLMRNPYPLRQV
ncbi:hypothetical protein PM082_023750 [Marasmius tenuissimus]|nr:hypothetical protein PM082_023750 [Marasmius tenuissimus]